MQTLGVYKGPDVLPPRRNQLRIPSREFTCDRNKPRRRKIRISKFWALLCGDLSKSVAVKGLNCAALIANISNLK